MRRALADGYELDDDRARVDIEVTHAFLTESYWAEGRTRATVARLVADAARVVGLYHGDEMVGFCRIESDEVTYAFLFDVFVLLEHRGRGLGIELVREAVERGPHADLPWQLGTSDAHALYERFGFRPPNVDKLMTRPGTRRT
jgi:GNAT superfamily N-acetyltransferase